MVSLLHINNNQTSQRTATKQSQDNNSLESMAVNICALLPQIYKPGTKRVTREVQKLSQE
jgi:hypothetical protein